MGNLADMGKITTVGQLTSDLGISPDRMRKRIVRASEKSPELFPDKSASADRVLSAEQVAVLSGKSAGRPARKPFGNSEQLPAKKESRSITIHQPAPGVTMPPAGLKAGWLNLPTFHAVRRFIISALLFCVVVLHGVLIWYDCSELWGVPGKIGGGAVFVVVLAALFMASDATLNRTSGFALAFMAIVDFAACKVHYEVFKTPLVENSVTLALCMFICASSFVALWLFRDSKLD